MATTLTLLSSMAPREALAAASALYQQDHAVSVRLEAAGGVDVTRRIAAGEAVDVVVLSNDAIDKLIQDGHLAAESRTDLMNSGIAVAVPAGAAHPDLSDETAVKHAVLAAASVSYSTGPSGRYLEQLFARWGILERLRPRIIVPPPGVPVARLLASGEVKLGFQQFSELCGVPGIDVLGPLPARIQQVTTFTGASTTRCSQADAARAFLGFVAAPGLDALKRRHGMSGIGSGGSPAGPA